MQKRKATSKTGLWKPSEEATWICPGRKTPSKAGTLPAFFGFSIFINITPSTVPGNTELMLFFLHGHVLHAYSPDHKLGKATKAYVWADWQWDAHTHTPPFMAQAQGQCHQGLREKILRKTRKSVRASFRVTGANTFRVWSDSGGRSEQNKHLFYGLVLCCHGNLCLGTLLFCNEMSEQWTGDSFPARRGKLVSVKAGKTILWVCIGSNMCRIFQSTRCIQVNREVLGASWTKY